ncbi:MAG: hypothetical protein ACFHHU_00335 [Porticoccaceae bacterium]
MSTKLIHWSQEPLNILKSDEGWRFIAKTQGRAYTIAMAEPSARTTKPGKQQSAIIFIGEAARKFEKHPWCTLFGFKRLFGQYWTTRVGDLVWREEDIEQVHDDVLIVKDFSIVPIKRENRLEVYGRIVARWALDIAVSATSVFLIGLKFLIDNFEVPFWLKEVWWQVLKYIPKFTTEFFLIVLVIAALGIARGVHVAKNKFVVPEDLLSRVRDTWDRLP